MELTLIAIFAVVILGAGGIVFSHSAIGTKIETLFETKFNALKTELAPKVATLESTVSADWTASLASIHEKIDALRASIGGVYTEAEKSAIVQDLEAKVKQAEDIVASVASGMTDAKALLAAFKGTPAVPTIVPPVVTVTNAAGVTVDAATGLAVA